MRQILALWMLTTLSCVHTPLCVPHTTVWVGRTPDPAALEAACSDYARYTGRKPWEMLEGYSLLVWSRPDVKEACRHHDSIACTIQHPGAFVIVLPQEPTTSEYGYHEMMHVLLHAQGVPGDQHHSIMRRWRRRDDK